MRQQPGLRDLVAHPRLRHVWGRFRPSEGSRGVLEQVQAAHICFASDDAEGTDLRAWWKTLLRCHFVSELHQRARQLVDILCDVALSALCQRSLRLQAKQLIVIEGASSRCFERRRQPCCKVASCSQRQPVGGAHDSILSSNTAMMRHFLQSDSEHLIHCGT